MNRLLSVRLKRRAIWIALGLLCCLSTTAQTVSLKDGHVQIQGIKYLTPTESGIRFRRHREDILQLPMKELGLNPEKSRNATGGIITFKTASPEFEAHFKIVSANYMGTGFGVFENGELIKEFKFGPKETDAVLKIVSQSEGESLFEIALPSFSDVEFENLDADTTALPPIRKKVYVALGDSISHGTGQDGYGHKTWPFLLARNLGYELFNLAVGGGKISVPTAEMLADWDAIDLITILIGYNDLHFDGKTPEQYRDKYNELLDTIRTHHPDTRIICITPLYTRKPVSEKTGATIDQFRGELESLVLSRQANDAKLVLVKGEEISSEANLRSANPNDPVHLGVEGAELFANAIEKEIRLEPN